MSYNIPIKNPFNNGRSEADRRAGEQYNPLYEGDISLNEIKILVLLPSLTAFARQG